MVLETCAILPIFSLHIHTHWRATIHSIFQLMHTETNLGLLLGHVCEAVTFTVFGVSISESLSHGYSIPCNLLNELAFHFF